MIELLIAACLSLGPPECRDFPLHFDPAEFSLTACAVRGQHEIVRWCESHPKWTVTRWTCAYRAPGSVDI
ncbi:MAG TPA: hypothetical protein VEG34_13415 [Thermoanaerobaculia bacterium]|nr:hypothetical protein [Thermoanaerobaculia bacterium]